MTDETAIVARKAELVVGSDVRAIVPRNIEETMRLATGIFESGLAPSSFRSAAQVMVAILSGAEIGLPPMQAIQSIAIINGRPCLWGDGMLAVIRKEGVTVKEWLEGTGDDMIAWCEMTRPDTHEVITRHFSVEMAKRAKLWGKKGRNGEDTPWITYRERMLQMRARSWTGRDGCADILKGFSIVEEVQDQALSEITTTSGLAARLQAGREGGFKPSAVDDALDAVIEEGQHVLEEIEEEASGIMDEEYQRGIEAALEPEETPAPTFTLDEEAVGEPEEDIIQWCADFNRMVHAWDGSKDGLVKEWETATQDGHLERLHATSPASFGELKKVVSKKVKSIK